MPDRLSFRYGKGFRSLTAETREPVRLAVSGTLPSWLEGTLLRTGPAKFEVGARTFNHWFDGFAMLHRFAIADGASLFLIGKLLGHANARTSERYAHLSGDPLQDAVAAIGESLMPAKEDAEPSGEGASPQ